MSNDVSLELLTGVRSSKHTFYPEFRRKAQGLERAIDALERVSFTLGATTAGPEALAHAVVDATADHFGGLWAAMALSGEAFPEEPPTLVAHLAQAAVTTDWAHLPPVAAKALTRVLDSARSAVTTDGMRPSPPRAEVFDDLDVLGTPLYLRDEVVGALVVGVRDPADITEEDLAVLSTLGSHSAVALQNACLYQESERLRAKAAAALEMAEHHGKELEVRNSQLQRAQDRLLHARQSRILDQERNRIARDLHDSVAQHLVSIGMNLEWCLQQEEIVPMVRERLVVSRGLARQTVTCIRQTIFELSTPDEDRLGLRVALQDLAVDFMKTAQLDVSVRFVGHALSLPAAAEHALFQVAQEAMFNVVKHSLATRTTIELRYKADSVSLVIADNGFGDPASLRAYTDRQPDPTSPYHRGLGNMAERVRELGGKLSISRRRGGGVRVSVRAPVPKRRSGD